jgi:hypothetical protein
MRNLIIILHFVIALLTIYVSAFADNKYKYVNASPSLILRESSNQNSDKLLSIPKGKKILVIDESTNLDEVNGKKGKWVKVEWNDETGWVFDAYLSDVFPDSLFSMKELVDFVGNFNFNGYYEKSSKKEIFVSFNVTNHKNINSSYEAGGASSTIKNITIRQNNVLILVEHLIYEDDYIENDNPGIKSKQMFTCNLSKNQLLQYISDNKFFEIKCVKE